MQWIYSAGLWSWNSKSKEEINSFESSRPLKLEHKPIYTKWKGERQSLPGTFPSSTLSAKPSTAKLSFEGSCFRQPKGKKRLVTALTTDSSVQCSWGLITPSLITPSLITPSLLPPQLGAGRGKLHPALSWRSHPGSTTAHHSTVEGQQCCYSPTLAWSLVFRFYESSINCFQGGKWECKGPCSSSSLSILTPIVSPLPLSSPYPQKPWVLLPSPFPMVPPSQTVFSLFFSSFGPFHFPSWPPLSPSFLPLRLPTGAGFHIPHPCSC